MNRRISVRLDRAMVARPVVVEIPNPNGPRDRVYLTRTEARELKDQLATTLNPKGGRHGR